MTLASRVWNNIVSLTLWLTMSPWNYPHFKPPGADPSDAEFKCDYPEMKGFSSCSTAENRSCWIRHEDGREFNITTDYEKFVPVGITRNYFLNVTNYTVNADGIPFKDAKVFNETHPGPWIQACWGDTINVTVLNSLPENGTSIHWHGIRQHLTMPMDGVNGITQCPIAPGHNFTYTFKATQYGSSWYHSHYSVQYADGLQGPLTIHGPHSAPYDKAKKPLIMTDWSHESAFNLLFKGAHMKNETLLLNGTGDVTRFCYAPETEIPAKYEMAFEKTAKDALTRPKRYLLRLINTSFASTIVFSIDNHLLQVVSADFVPIEPYLNKSVLIGIGQRYNVIVEANPQEGADNPIPDDHNFWIRTWVADNCGVKPGIEGVYEKTGILRYDRSNRNVPRSSRWPKSEVSQACSDETYTSLKPMLPWTVLEAKNANLSFPAGEQFNLTLNTSAGATQEFADFPLAAFSLQRFGDSKFRPFQINYSKPVLLNLSEPSETFPSRWVIIPEDYKDDDWVSLVLTIDSKSTGTRAHPIHLHGHDFAILQQVEGEEYHPSKLNLNRNNPPRRDVVLLPTGGFVVIAFKTDNPGSWLMHCHIARHASEGLALQILERQRDADELFPQDSPSIIEAKRTCKAWEDWRKKHPELFEGDSGI